MTSNSVVVGSLKALDPGRPIREADMAESTVSARSVYMVTLNNYLAAVCDQKRCKDAMTARAYIEDMSTSTRVPGGEAMVKSNRKPNRASKRKSVTISALKRAIEGRNAAALAAMYAQDAVMQVVDKDNPPSKPRRLNGKAAISAYFGDVCGRDMTHKIESGIAGGNRLAFTQSCAYPDGTKVFCSAMVDLKKGKIAHQTVVQAWDA